MATLRDRTDQVGVRDARDVVEVQRIGGVVRTGDVRGGPVRRPAQVVPGVGVRETMREIPAVERQRELRRAPFQIVTPLLLRVERERDHRQQVTARVRVGQVEDVLCRTKAPRRERRIARREHLEALGEGRRVAAGEVGADRRPRGAGPEDRPVTDEAERRIPPVVVIVGLREPPDIVVAGGRVVPFADPHLVVERAGPVVPHPQEPIRSEPGLPREVRRRPRAHLRGEVPDTRQQDRVGVAGRLHELQVVAGIPPAAGRADPRAERMQRPPEFAAVGVVAGRRVGHRVAIV